MKTINPFYILTALIVLFFVLVYELSSLKKELITVKEDSLAVQQMAKYTSDLKRTWSNKKYNKTSILKLLSAAQLRDSGLTKQVKKDRVVISADSLDEKSTTYLLNKLLNGTFTLLSFKLKRLDENSMNIKIEVKL